MALSPGGPLDASMPEKAKQQAAVEAQSATGKIAAAIALERATARAKALPYATASAPAADRACRRGGERPIGQARTRGEGPGQPAPEAKTAPEKPEPDAKVLPTLSSPPRPAVDAPAQPEGRSLFGVLDAEQRIRRAAEQHERTLWAGAIAATLLYAGIIGSQAMLTAIGLTPAEQQQLEQERRGQDANSISVELVPDPDKTAKTQKWRDGADAAAPQPSEQPPQPFKPPQVASTAEPEEKETEPTKDPTQDKADDGSRMMLDIDSLVDAAAADLSHKIDRAFQKKPQKERREQQAVISGGDMKIRGTGAAGKSDAFSRSVIAALMKTRPGPFALWGRVLVSFQISPSGTLNYVHLLQSSGNSALDRAAIEAIHKARFEMPPPNLNSDQRTYIIDYIFG